LQAFVKNVVFMRRMDVSRHFSGTILPPVTIIMSKGVWSSHAQVNLYPADD